LLDAAISCNPCLLDHLASTLAGPANFSAIISCNGRNVLLYASPVVLGNYSISVTYDGVDVRNSPKSNAVRVVAGLLWSCGYPSEHFLLAGSLSVMKSFTTGPSEASMAGDLVTVYISGRDQSGNIVCVSCALTCTIVAFPRSHARRRTLFLFPPSYKDLNPALREMPSAVATCSSSYSIPRVPGPILYT